MGVDVIEIGYPGLFSKDFDEIRAVSSQVKTPIICRLAGSKPDEIERVASALETATRGRISEARQCRLR
jgi:2-isopropylmalate synthase